MAWGLGPKGFERPNQADLRTDMDIKARELFGDDINLSPKSFLGLTIGLVSWFLAKGYEIAEYIYKSGHITEAEGVHLDYHTPYFSTSRQPEQFAEVELTLTGRPYSRILAGTRFETEAGFDYALKTDVIIDESGRVTAEAVSLTPGTVGNALANTITVRSEPSSEIFSVTNPYAAAGGREEETDKELIERLTNSSSNLGSATLDSILSAVLSVQGVRSAFVKENNTINVVDGQKPKSFQVFAFGGDGQAIAEAIHSKGAGGIEPFGTVTYVVKDISGNDQYIAYTPAATVSVYVTVSLTTDKTFESDGIAKVKKAIKDLISGNMENDATSLGLALGEDIIRFQIERAIGKIQGVTDASVYLGKNQAEQTANNIAIAPNEIAVIEPENIVVKVES